MTMSEAIERACGAAQRTGERWAVICRTDHPHIPGEYFYAIRYADKRRWTAGEYLLALV